MNLAAQKLGRLGGRAKSAAKTAAARENAKLGGWPKGRPRKRKPKKQNIPVQRAASDTLPPVVGTDLKGTK